MTSLYTDLTDENRALLHELNAERAKAIALEAELDKSETARYALMGEVVTLRKQLDAVDIDPVNRARLTLTDRGDAADGYHPGEVEP